MKTKKIFEFVAIGFFAVLFLFGGLVVFSLLPISGNIKLLTVLSGSMEPSVHTGSLIFIKPTNNYKVGDIVTRKTSDAKVTVTHRISEKKVIDGKTIFNTKGDANNSDDNEKVTPEMIVGRVFLNIPYLGYAVGFAKTKHGLIIIILIPALIIIFDELVKIKNEVINIIKKKKEGENGEKL